MIDNNRLVLEAASSNLCEESVECFTQSTTGAEKESNRATDSRDKDCDAVQMPGCCGAFTKFCAVRDQGKTTII